MFGICLLVKYNLLAGEYRSQLIKLISPTSIEAAPEFAPLVVTVTPKIFTFPQTTGLLADVVLVVVVVWQGEDLEAGSEVATVVIFDGIAGAALAYVLM